ncbi:hypothetical protein HK101_003595, partial [Irineochytrium annulatum]
MHPFQEPMPPMQCGLADGLILLNLQMPEAAPQYLYGPSQQHYPNYGYRGSQHIITTQGSFASSQAAYANNGVSYIRHPGVQLMPARINDLRPPASDYDYGQ